MSSALDHVLCVVVLCSFQIIAVENYDHKQ